MIERWKPVSDYEDLYQVSDQGRVRRIAGGPGTHVGLILRPRNDTHGYPHVYLYRNGHRRQRMVHSLVTEVFIGLRPDGLQVNHKNGIRDDNSVGNLEYVTPGENQKHSYRVLGREPARVHGEAHGSAKLTAAKVRQIRGLYARGGTSYRKLAQRYGVSSGAIRDILHRKNWVHVA